MMSNDVEEKGGLTVDPWRKADETPLKGQGTAIEHVPSVPRFRRLR
jgi:hypothetical protein